MRIKPYFILSSIIYSTTLFAANSDWKQEVENDILEGNFKKAVSTLNTLPTRELEQNYYTVDSLKAIINRINQDFSLKPSDGKSKIAEIIPNITDEQIDEWIKNQYIEVKTIDGQQMWFRKSVRNLFLLCPDIKSTKSDTDLQQYIECVESIKNSDKDKNFCSNWNRVKVKFTLDVKENVVPDGNIIKAWLPIPLKTVRQKNFKLLSTSGKIIESKGSPHNTVQIEEVAQKDKKTHFEIIFTYDVAAQSFPREYIMNKLKPYKKSSKDYIKYTSSDNRHIIIDDDMRQLANVIVGDETNPVMQAATIYDWIGKNFPWAGARDYGTIPNIPRYVLSTNHGDCGQVAMLYITLVRALGIPARWESGWMLHPWDKNYHDWTETYFEGVGWVPTDVSLSRKNNQEVKDFYKTGTDMYRFASNSDYGKPLFPIKKYIRTEPIDFQAGEVEWTGGNIEIKDFNSSLSIINFEPIKH